MYDIIPKNTKPRERGHEGAAPPAIRGTPGAGTQPHDPRHGSPPQSGGSRKARHILFPTLFDLSDLFDLLIRKYYMRK